MSKLFYMAVLLSYLLGVFQGSSVLAANDSVVFSKKYHIYVDMWLQSIKYDSGKMIYSYEKSVKDMISRSKDQNVKTELAPLRIVFSTLAYNFEIKQLQVVLSIEKNDSVLSFDDLTGAAKSFLIKKTWTYFIINPIFIDGREEFPLAYFDEFVKSFAIGTDPLFRKGKHKALYYHVNDKLKLELFGEKEI